MLHYKFLVYIFFVLMISGNANSKETREKPQHSDKGTITGAETEADPDNLVFKEMAKESLNKYLQEIRSNRYHEVQVTHVTTQVVAGMLTRINFDALPTTCLLTNGMEPINPPCIIIKPYKIISCYSEIWERQWLNAIDMNVRCAPRT